jgi:hypothetical protein
VATRPVSNGAERDRTAGLQSAILALSQLSYCPGITSSESRLSCFMRSTQNSVLGALNNGEGGIRTHGTRRYTHFPGVPIQPLSHLSKQPVLSTKFRVIRCYPRRNFVLRTRNSYLRRGWDSNPRCPEAQRFSRPSDSTTLAPLQKPVASCFRLNRRPELINL